MNKVETRHASSPIQPARMHVHCVVMMLITALTLGACGGGGGSSSVSATTDTPVAGAGVKGPLAGAVVNLYQVDLSAADLKGSLLDQGVTDASTAIHGLTLPAGTSGFVMVEFVADSDTIDITSGAYPLIDTMMTVVDVQRIIEGSDVYATPLTSMAISLALANADRGSPWAGDGNSIISETEFTLALNIAQQQVKDTFGFGIDTDLDIFSVAPLITAATDTQSEQTQVAQYRQAIEAICSLAQKVADDSSANDTPQQIFTALTEDLRDGVIDGNDSGTPIAV
ncbi:MAG: hypothetical protein MI756_17105, partial [Chromatiales bacterium]|nr:hypothetical protein [Chromatiales bacterium]